jgi:probable DNA metabolism protein
MQWTDVRDAQLHLEDDAPFHPSPAPARHVMVPASFVQDAQLAACHRSHLQWALLYRLLWRLTHGERHALRDPLDADASRLEAMVREVRRDEHKMHAFVRFRRVEDAEKGERFVAFHRPDHHIVELVAPFFVERFGTMRWSILTPDDCVHWDGATLRFTPGVDASAAPAGDALEELWRTYYASIFNPARVNVRAMQRELPRRHWATLPEARAIPSLVADASRRVDLMLTEPARTTSARPFIPKDASLDVLRAAAGTCRGCDLFAHASHVVFGEGPRTAPMMLVGEQPGDEEDRRGVPFVGPAGQVLADAIDEAGLDRADLYVTNAVKHFTYRREGKRRIHERPRITDVRACRPWLEAEIDKVRPDVIVCLGSTAAQTLIGPQVRIQRDRGKTFTSAWAPHVMVTYHPSAVLRADVPQHRDELLQWLIADLRSAARLAPRLLTARDSI